MADLLTVDQFASRVKEKYPEYGELDNKELTAKVLEKYPEYRSQVSFSDNPTLTEIGTGLAAEIAIAESAKYVGAIGGTAAAPVIGTAVGYVGGAISGGIAGSIAAQKIEGREDISVGRVVADTLLNLIPGSKLYKGGKASKVVLPQIAGAKNPAVKIFENRSVRKVGKRAAAGAAISTGAAQVEKGIEEGELLTAEELLTVAGTGAALNIGLGATSDFISSYRKFAGKSPSVLDAAYEKGDHDAISVVENLAGEKPEGRGDRWWQMLQAKMLPETTLGPKITNETHKIVSKSRNALDLASTIRDEYARIAKKLPQEQKDQIDDYVFGRTGELIPEGLPIKPTLDLAKEKINEYQKDILKLYKNGRLDLHEDVAAKIMKSIDTKDYSTREYRFFEDSTFKPSTKSEVRLRNALIKNIRGNEDKKERMASDFIQAIKDSRTKAMEGLNLFAGNKKIFQKRNDLIPELREYLGEYKGTGEKLFGTLSRMGRLVAIEEGNYDLTHKLVKYGLAQVRADGQAIPDNMRLLFLGKKAQKVGKRNVYVADSVQEALNEISATGLRDEGIPTMLKWLGQSVATTTAAAKFVRVPLNLASHVLQPISNAFLVAGQGMNPFYKWGKGARVSLNELNKKGIRGGNLSIKEVNRLKELDLVDKGVIASDIRDGFKKGLIGNILDKGAEPFGKVYNIFDTAQRISVFENYKALAPKMIKPESFKNMSKERVEGLAAELTNLTYQNYGRINKNFRALSRYGILNEFAAFNLELSRTVFNQAKMIRSMLNGKFADDLAKSYGVKANKEFIKKEGTRRLVALSSVLGAASFGVTALNRMGGVSGEVESAYRETIVAPWEKNQTLHMSPSGSGLSLANLSYQVPHAELTSIMEAGLRGEGLVDAVGKTGESFWDKFGGDLTINFKTLIEAASNTKLTTGRRISNEADALRRRLDLAKYYFAEAFTPGTVADLRKAKDRTAAQNLLRYTLGYRVRNTTYEESVGYKLRDLKKNLKGLRSEYSSAIYSGENLAERYAKNNETYKRNMRQLVRHVNNLRLINSQIEGAGLDEKKIEQILKGANFNTDERAQILSGQIGNMRIASGISGNRREKMQKYIEIAEKMPPEMAEAMLRQEVQMRKLNQRQAQLIIGGLKLKQAIE